LDTIFELEDMM